MHYLHLILFSSSIFIHFNCQEITRSPNQIVQDKKVGGNCECCEAWKEGIPDQLDWSTQISAKDEPGEALEINGVIFQKDGKTPAENIVLYLYHTDANGEYSRGTDLSPCTKRHGKLRGWMKTGKDGRYRFKTIRPASYPNTVIEQHIHAVIKEPGLTEYWIDSYIFEDDPNLDKEDIARYGGLGGSGLIFLTKNQEGVWLGERNIILGKNIQGY